jgi:NAD+ synthase (glutamine-hydrolysing)
MKIALAQLNYHIGNFQQNTEKIVEAINKGKKQGADIVVFAELAVSGYPPRDFLEFNDFIERCTSSIQLIAEASSEIAVIIGSPVVNNKTKGKGLFNAAVVIEDGQIIKYVHKSLLPNYDIFDEYRYFESGRDFSLVEIKGKKIALTICEDLWDVGDTKLYTVSPMEELMKHNPDVMINIAASPFHVEQAKTRKDILKANVNEYKVPLFYVNHVGAQTELLFDGGSLVIDKDGNVVVEAAYFEEDFIVADLDNLPTEVIQEKETDKIALIHDALVMGVKNYFNKLGFKQAILGLSGGIDSAVTLAIAERALGAENVYAILLPSMYSSDHSIKDAQGLAQNLKVAHEIIPIQHPVESVEMALSPYFKNLPFGIAEENIQARMRGLILMAMSNKFGHILLNTSNKSEAAVGYGTLYGDMNGGLSVLGDVYKTDVFALARYINKDAEVIPVNTIVKPPSAELRPDQKDSDSLPDYDILDEILYLYIEERKGPKEIISLGFEEPLVNRILRLVNINEYKRYQTAPTLRVSSKAFGMGRRIPIVAKYLS